MKAKSPGYNEAFTEIQDILSKIENGEPDVDELAAMVKRSSYLIKLCKSKLLLTEEEIKKILNEDMQK
jgi:exodeoxyribonuclease VII small subunit